MPVDPTILRKYGGLGSEPPPEKRSPWPAMLTFLIGTALIGGYFLLFRDSRPMMQGLIYFSFALGACLLAYAVYDGWQEDGLLGAIWRYDSPLGLIWSDDTSAVIIILWVLAGGSFVLGAVGLL